MTKLNLVLIFLGRALLTASLSHLLIIGVETTTNTSVPSKYFELFTQHKYFMDGVNGMMLGFFFLNMGNTGIFLNNLQEK